jgi:uncharacterized protein YjbJ (UPF0337 family)
MRLATEIKGEWHQLKGMLKQKWGDLTNDDLEKTEGEKERLIGLLMKKYDMSHEIATKELSRYWPDLQN